MRTRAERRHYAQTNMWRRLNEHRNCTGYKAFGGQCFFFDSPKRMARFKEQPQVCSCMACGNARQYEGPTLQERRADDSMEDMLML